MIKPNKPFPIRLKELKQPLQLEAVDLDRSLHWLIFKILKKHVDSGGGLDNNPILERNKNSGK